MLGGLIGLSTTPYLLKGAKVWGKGLSDYASAGQPIKVAQLGASGMLVGGVGFMGWRSMQTMQDRMMRVRKRERKRKRQKERKPRWY